MDGVERERKFLLSKVPGDLRRYPGTQMAQGYLSIEKDSEVRIRREIGPDGVEFTRTVKRGEGAERQEMEVRISETEFVTLWPKTLGQVEKVRYRIPYEDLTIELDVYVGRLIGLVVAEVEFRTAAAMSDFIPPGWFGHEVTSSTGYKNKNLAITGNPLERPECNLWQKPSMLSRTEASDTGLDDPAESS